MVDDAEATGTKHSGGGHTRGGGHRDRNEDNGPRRNMHQDNDRGDRQGGKDDWKQFFKH